MDVEPGMLVANGCGRNGGEETLDYGLAATFMTSATHPAALRSRSVKKDSKSA